MIVEFIGQGIHSEDYETTGNHVCSAINDSAFTQITVFVAFIRKPGLIYLKPFIEKALKEGRELTFYVGIDECVTSKEALELLLSLNVQTYIYNSDRYIYHPKIYLFEGERNRIITGSSNLTKSGLFYNVESSILLDFTNNDKSGIKVLNQLKEYYAPLLDFSDSNIVVLSPAYLQELVEKELVSIENYEGNSEGKSKTHDKSKPKGKNPEIPELGTIEIKDNKPPKKYISILKITEEYLEKWDFMFVKMQAFQKDNNHCTVPKDYKDRTLYGWYRKQKQLYEANLMPEEHQQKLESINFYFGDSHPLFWERKWLESYNQLFEIYKQTGDSNIKRYKDNTHPLFYISNWVAIERGKYKNEKLKQWQIEKLENIGFQWDMSGVRTINNEDGWLDNLALLEQYKLEFGDCNVSQTFKDERYPQLGKWLNDQRDHYKKKRKILSQDRIELLEELGVVWDMDVFKFQKFIDQLSNFKIDNGNFNISSSYKPNPSLGNYVYRIKTKGVKEEWKIKMLHDIGFFEIGTQKKKDKQGHITTLWFKKLEKLKKIPNPNLNKDDKEYPELAAWVHGQRRAFRYGKLKDEQIVELEKLRVKLPATSKKSKRWHDYIELIELFIEEYGDAEITREFDEELYKWISQQKTNYSVDKLRKEKADKLIELGILNKK
ncbi:Helicase associated domain protein [Saccharicrinis aurantiacus]|uniref:Helicase associated domain protein n=1 Tax=Saccharicrinis aurantiacus TaxID=1849719 RepID=UPI00249062E8|nr:Helicase associated domain protein [Saccharicrinis aurantiacus]